MFDFFDDPLDDFFYYPRYARRPTYVDDYYDKINARLNQVLKDEFGLPPNPTRQDIAKRAHELHKQEKGNKDEKPAEKDDKGSYNSYFYSSSSYSNGKDFVEEHREKMTDKDGKVHSTTRKRLGDRWCETQSLTDENGKTSTKETWHNVPEDQIESFKAEWSKKHGEKYQELAHEDEKKAVTHDEKK